MGFAKSKRCKHFKYKKNIDPLLIYIFLELDMFLIKEDLNVMSTVLINGKYWKVLFLIYEYKRICFH